jgi:Signal transduction histidine kinase regulating C4-dicarboxylate transport system
MNPSSTLRVRRATAGLFLAWAVGAIVLSLAALRAPGDRLYHPFTHSRIPTASRIDEIAPSAKQSGIEHDDLIVAMNGRPFNEVLREGTQSLDPARPNTYLLEKRDGRRIEVTLAPEPIAWTQTTAATALHALMVLVAAFYLVTGGAAWWLKSDRSEAWALQLFCCTMAAQLATIPQTNLIPLGWPRMLVNVPLIGATTFHLFTTYPIEPGWVVRHRRAQFLPYAAALFLAVFSLGEREFGAPIGLGLTLSYAFTDLLMVSSLAIVAVERHNHGDGPLRNRADLMFWAALVTFGPILLIYLAEWALRTPFPSHVAMLWLSLFPVAVCYGIVRRQLFEVRSVAKSSAAYGAATLAITGVFAFLITFADAAVSRLNVSFRWFQVTFLFFAILAFNPLRNRLQNLVDRFFDRDRETYRVAVREISEAMVSMLSLPEIADRILLALTDTMGVERAMVMMVDDDGKVLRSAASRGEWDDDDLALEIRSDHPIWKHLWMRREDLSRLDFDEEPDVEYREACRDVFDTLEVELLVPILYGVDLLGVIAVGRKISGDRLVGDDRTLLRTLANQSSIAIENAKAFDEIAKLNETLEARVEERTAELQDTQAQLVQAEKMKSLGQLVAGVAHELNNPIGFVHANLQLLDEYVRKFVEAHKSGGDPERAREAITKLLARSREGTERVKKIVQDLRTFSRMDHAELQDVDLHEEIERTLALMEPRFKNGVTVERDFGELPRVRCYAGQLNQVFLNLLMNACDAMKDQGRITIRTRRGPLGVRLSFKDDGPGIPENVRTRIFDPFFTTKPVGEGTGLGLSLSHGIIERHGGSIQVESEPGKGATFVIDLPLVPLGDALAAAR